MKNIRWNINPITLVIAAFAASLVIKYFVDKKKEKAIENSIGTDSISAAGAKIGILNLIPFGWLFTDI